MANTEITVRGNATVSKKPDTIRISLSFDSKDEAYAGAIDNLNMAISETISLFKQCGVIEEPQTDLFSINEWWDNEYSDAAELQGYEASQHLEARIDMNMDRLQLILVGFSNSTSSLKPRVRLNFEVRDSETMLKEARKQAINAAKRSAEEIAAQLDLKIVGIKTIEYNQPFSGTSSSIALNFSEDDTDLVAQASMPVITPKDVMRRDDVTITWECQTLS
jgi:uncharacterized protein YggE